MANPLKIGMNLTTVGATFGSQPFLNAFKTGGGSGLGWNARVNSSLRYAASAGVVNLNSDGYPTDSNGKTGSVAAGQTFTVFDSCILFGLVIPPNCTERYRSGQYVFLWDGAFSASNFTWTGLDGGDAVTIVSSQANRIIIDVTSGTGGIRTYMTNVGVGGLYPTNIRLVYGDAIHASDVVASAGAGGSTTAGTNGTGTYEAQLNSGKVCNPDFFDRVSPFYMNRYMDWLATVTNTAQAYSSLSTTTSCFWNTVPYEAQVAVSNEMGSHAWFNLPHQANYDLATQAATAILGSTDSDGNVWAPLDPTLEIWIEHGNEVWQNNAQTKFLTAVANGKIAFPGWQNNADAVRRWCCMKTVQHGKIWQAILGGTYTVNVVQGGQSANTGLNEAFLGYTATQAGGLTFSGTGSISGNTLTIDPGVTGTVSLFQEVSGTGVASPTYISALGTGTGGAGTYTVSGDAQTVASTALTGTYYSGTVGSNIDAFAVAPYFGENMPPFGTATGAQATAGSIGSTSVTLAAAGSGRINAGDIVKFGGDSNQYKVSSGVANVSVGGTLTLSSSTPLLQQISSAVTVTEYTPSTTELFQEINLGTYLGSNTFQVVLSCTASISGTTMTVTAVSTGNSAYPVLYPGQEILSGAASGTRIVTQLTSTTAFPSGRYGTTGTYQVSISQNVSSTAMSLTSGCLAQAYAKTWQNKRTADQFSLPLVLYESGQGFVANDSAGGFTTNLMALYLDAVRDTRMGTAYTEYFTTLQSVADPVFINNFADANEQSNFGQWGVLENIMATSSPRYDAILALAGNTTTVSASLPMPLRLRLRLW